MTLGPGGANWLSDWLEILTRYHDLTRRMLPPDIDRLGKQLKLFALKVP